MPWREGFRYGPEAEAREKSVFHSQTDRFWRFPALNPMGRPKEYRRKYNHKERNSQSARAVVSRHRKLCDQLYVSRKCYRLRFQSGTMSFRKDAAEIGAIEAMMGKNIIVADNHGWTTEEIVSASLDRYRIEQQFRVSKASCHVQVNPMFHWTDGKIRCHLLTCVIALACLRLLEIKTGDKHTARSIME